MAFHAETRHFLVFLPCVPANVLHFVNNLQRRLKGRVMTHSLLDVDVFPTPKLLYTHEFIIITWLLDSSLCTETS